MPLTLTIANIDFLENGSPRSLVLDRRGATIGRATTADWCLPDPTLHVSSRHCDIVFRGGAYELIDTSTNGTFLQGHGARLPGPHSLRHGDVFLVGRFEIAVALDEQSAMLAATRNADPPQPAWRGWDAASTGQVAPPAGSAWDQPAYGSAISGTGPMSQNWAPPQPAPAPPSPGSGWGAAALGEAAGPGWGAPAAPAGWGAAAAAPSNDVWSTFAASNDVDWARGGFGGAAAPASATPQRPVTPPPSALAPPSPHAPPPQAPPPAAPPPDEALHAFLTQAGVAPRELDQGATETLAQAGMLVRRLIAGLVVMLEARARAKSQMGAQGTGLHLTGNNPLKFARTPDQAVAMMLNPPERGFMPADSAIEDSFRDLQAHQVATLRAMQGALRATLDRFSPQAIRRRSRIGGFLAKVLPWAADAQLWQAYEREFSGVAHGSDEAFMDVFAREFRRAYEEQSFRR